MTVGTVVKNSTKRLVTFFLKESKLIDDLLIK